MNYRFLWLLVLLGCATVAVAKVKIREQVSCADPGAARLGWTAFGVGTLDRGEGDGELWHVVNWSETAKWGVGNRFTFKQPVNLGDFRAVELEVRSDQEEAGAVYLGIESQRGRTSKTPVASAIALTTSWKKAEFPVASFQDSSFEPRDRESVTQLKVFFVKPGGAAKEKIMFRNVVLIP